MQYRNDDVSVIAIVWRYMRQHSFLKLRNPEDGCECEKDSDDFMHCGGAANECKCVERFNITRGMTMKNRKKVLSDMRKNDKNI